VAIGSVVFAAACGEGSARIAASTVSDSAGIAITESSAPRWADAEGWTISPSALVDIGVTDGPPEYQLSRVEGVLRLVDGRIVVANGGSQELRFYDPGGQHLRTVGGQGSGPGEFRRLGGVTLASDSLLVLDPILARLTAFDGDGTLLDTRPMEPTGDPVHPLRNYGLGGVMGEMMLLLVPRLYPADMTPQPETKWDTMPNLLYTSTGELSDTLGEVSGMDLHSTSERAGGLLFGRYTTSFVHGDTVYITDGGRYEVRLYGPDGRLGRIVRLRRDRRPVTAADMSALKASFMSRARGQNAEAEVQRALAMMPSADHKPWISNLLVDELHNLWVEEYRPHWVDPDAPKSWSVFDPRGRWLGVVDMPNGLTPRQIGTDFLLGVWKDAHDVEHVRVYSLTRG
jgi:hypothetical protein